MAKRKRKNSDDTSAPRRTAAEVLLGAFEVPVDIKIGMPHMELRGNREIIIEGHKGITQYEEEIVRINCGQMMLKIFGRGLVIRSMSDEALIISGFFTSMEFVG